jgi:hypothetical protein
MYGNLNMLALLASGKEDCLPALLKMYYVSREESI